MAKEEVNKGGRPARFKTVEEMQERIDKYFESLKCIDPESRKQFTKPATITGLALHLGFCSRQSLYDYKDSDMFSYTIKTARLRVESSYEENLFTKNATGAIFGLKNLGWSDKQEIKQDLSVSGAPVISFGDTTHKEIN